MSLVNPPKVRDAGIRHQYVLISCPFFRLLGITNGENHKGFGLKSGFGLGGFFKWVFRGLWRSKAPLG